MKRSSTSSQARWLRTLHQWHWVSSALCLLGMLLFGVTGFTLNHAGRIEGRAQVEHRQETLPPELRGLVAVAAAQTRVEAVAVLPEAVQQWLRVRWGVDSAGREAEWSAEEVYLSLPSPGVDAWVRIDRTRGEAEFERSDRGWIAYFNDLHKGRHAGAVWSWWIDVFAAACLVFSVTGLFLLKMHAANRPGTWPVLGLGALIPILVALLFIH